jgi:ankyrin repeat protein
MHSDLNEQLVRLACPSSEDFKAIYAKGADFNQLDSSSGDTPFNDILISICAGDLLGVCIKAGASVNPITTTGTSPLIQAVMAQDYRSLVILLEEGADPNIACFTEDDPQTPLDIVYNEFHCTRRPADVKICEAMEMILRQFGGKTYSELDNKNK